MFFLQTDDRPTTADYHKMGGSLQLQPSRQPASGNGYVGNMLAVMAVWAIC